MTRAPFSQPKVSTRAEFQKERSAEVDPAFNAKFLRLLPGEVRATVNDHIQFHQQPGGRVEDYNRERERYSTLLGAVEHAVNYSLLKETYTPHEPTDIMKFTFKPPRTPEELDQRLATSAVVLRDLFRARKVSVEDERELLGTPRDTECLYLKLAHKAVESALKHSKSEEKDRPVLGEASAAIVAEPAGLAEAAR